MAAETRKVLLTLTIMFGLGFAAFGASPLLHQDHLPQVGQRQWMEGNEGGKSVCIVSTVREGRLVYNLPCSQMLREANRRLETQAALGYKIRPGFMQVTESRVTGDTPDEVTGVAVWRTLFGIPVGEERVDNGNKVSFGLKPGRWLLVWVAFLLAEGALGVYLLQQLWNAP